MVDKSKIRAIAGFTHEVQLSKAKVWFDKSLSFHEAAVVLNRNIDAISNGNVAFLYNAAVSLELILKAIIVGKNSKVKSTHSLQKLCTIAEIELSQNQQHTIELFTEIIIWLGRYPVPNTEECWDNFHDNIIENHKIRTTIDNRHIVSIDKARFPTMQNYITIWELFLSQYRATS